jgi:hypothetical protein
MVLESLLAFFSRLVLSVEEGRDLPASGPCAMMYPILYRADLPKTEQRHRERGDPLSA